VKGEGAKGNNSSGEGGSAGESLGITLLGGSQSIVGRNEREGLNFVSSSITAEAFVGLGYLGLPPQEGGSGECGNDFSSSLNSGIDGILCGCSCVIKGTFRIIEGTYSIIEGTFSIFVGTFSRRTLVWFNFIITPVVILEGIRDGVISSFGGIFDGIFDDFLNGCS